MNNFQPCYRPDIDGLRALAIVPVVAFHASPRWVPGGFVGVDVFFVISGYLISLIIFKSLENGGFSFSSFYARRIRRIFPALIAVTASCYALGWFVLLPEEFKQLGKHIAAGMAFVQNFVLWREAGYFDSASELKPLMHLWSLAVEEQFYLAYPALLWLAWRAGLRLVWVALAIAGASLGASITGVSSEPVMTFFLAHARFWELLTGSLLALVQSRPGGLAWLATRLLNRAFLASSLSLAGLLLILGAVFGYDRSTPFPGLPALTPVLGAALLLLAGPTAWVNRQLLARRGIVWIGRISYPLYLWHWPLLSFANILQAETPSRDIRFVAVGLSIVLAALTFYLIEQPVRTGKHGGFKVAVLCALAVGLGFLGFNTYQRDGLSFRLKQFEQQIALLNDMPSSKDSYCTHRYRVENSEHFYCRLQQDREPTFIVIGDSHAGRLYLGLDQVLRDTTENVLLLAVNGCPPFFDTISFDPRFPAELKELCPVGINPALETAMATDSIHTVVLASRGPLYLDKTGFFLSDDFADEKGHGRVLRNRDRPEIEDHYQIWETAMRRTLDRLTRTGKRIVFVLDNPELGFDPKSCVDSRPFRLGSPIRRPCTVSRSVFEQRNAGYRALVSRVLQDYPNVILSDSAAALCDEANCWGMRDRVVLYRDDDHLSLAGARLVAETLLRQLAGSR